MLLSEILVYDLLDQGREPRQALPLLDQHIEAHYPFFELRVAPRCQLHPILVVYAGGAGRRRFNRGRPLTKLAALVHHLIRLQHVEAEPE